TPSILPIAWRELMNQHTMQAFVVSNCLQTWIQNQVKPFTDSSKYLANCDKQRAFISEFDGPAGCAAITADKTYPFTNGRSFQVLQAEKQ
ncbi:hypothetical protein K443DRAFT_117252, partial [Laccaria amethystina LaAM-08-1]